MLIKIARLRIMHSLITKTTRLNSRLNKVLCGRSSCLRFFAAYLRLRQFVCNGPVLWPETAVYLTRPYLWALITTVLLVATPTVAADSGPWSPPDLGSDFFSEEIYAFWRIFLYGSAAAPLARICRQRLLHHLSNL
jgi:hypothetical protein